MASTPDHLPASGGGSKHTSDNWRLSRIEEELEKIEFTNSKLAMSPVILPGAKAGTLPRRSTPQQQQNSPFEWGNGESLLGYNLDGQGLTGQYYGGSSSTPNLDDDVDGIYSKAVIKPAYSGDKVLDSKEAVKFLTGKYDSLGRLKSLSGVSSPTSLSGDLSNGSFGSADFPPPPPEGFAPMTTSPAPMTTQPLPLEQMTSPARPPPVPRPSSARSHSAASQHPASQHPASQHPASQHPASQHPASPQPHHASGPHQMHQPEPETYYTMDGSQIPALAEQELLQVEMFYRSHKSEVFVCQSLVNMYFGSIRSSSSCHSPCRTEPGHWDFYKSGIPVLILDSGESRRKRKLHILLAERGTGFSLWRDTMNHLTNYSSPQSTFHTLHMSNDHTKLVGFRFVDAGAALEFFHRIMNLVADPNDDILNLGSGKGKKKLWGKSKDSNKKKKLPNKGDISTPCCFTHITKLDRSDGAGLVSGGTGPIQTAQSRDQSLSPRRQAPGYKHS